MKDSLTCTVSLGLPQESRTIRETVFVQEQGFNEEFDNTDKTAYHIVVWRENRAIATGRVFPVGSKAPGVWAIGRVAVLKDERKSGVGRRLISELENVALNKGAHETQLSSQVSARPFYEKVGYVAQGAEYLDQGCPHILMTKTVSQEL